MLLFLLAAIVATGIAGQASGATFPELSNSLVCSWKPGSMTVGFEDVEVIDQTAYITDANLPGLRVVSLVDPANPVQLGQEYTTDTVYELLVLNNVAYTRVGPDHVECFNVAIPSNPSATGNFGAYNDVSDFDVEGTEMCLGNGSDLVLLDITNINSPVERDRIALGGSLSIDMEGDFIYACATVSGTEHHLKVINATVPTSIVVIASLPLGSYYIDSMLLSGGTLFTSGRDNALASPTGGTVKSFDVSNKTAPVKIGEINAGGINNVGLLLSGNALFTGACAEGLVVIDVSNPSSLQPIGYYDNYQDACGGAHYAMYPQSLVDVSRGELVVFVSMHCGLNIVAFNSFDFPLPIETIILIIIVTTGGIVGVVIIISLVLKARKH